MKSKNLLLIGIFIISLYSCKEKNDSSIVETKTNMNIDIPLIAESIDNTKSGNSIPEKDYTFSGESSYSLSNLANSDNEIYNIQDVKPESGSILSFSGINESDEFYSLLLEWGYKTADSQDYTMQQPIDLLSFENSVKNGIFSVKMDKALAQIMSSININKDHSFQVKITGKSNFNINCIALLEIPVIVQSEALIAHFELF